ncbi:putative gnk2-like domain-containing protein [Tanacetum coccineum]
MKISTISYFFFLQLIIINVVNLAIAQSLTHEVFKCGVGDYPPNSPWEKNFKVAVNQLPDIVPQKGFAFIGEGLKSERAYTSGFCPSYVEPEPCKDCLKKLIPLFEKHCLRKKQAIAWLTKCMIRKSENDMYGKLDNWSYMPLSLPKKVLQVDAFDARWKKLAETLTEQVVSKSPSKSYNKLYLSGSESFEHVINMIVECVPDIQTSLCRTCLVHKIKEMKSCCSGTYTASLVSANCYIRHSTDEYIKV